MMNKKTKLFKDSTVEDIYNVPFAKNRIYKGRRISFKRNWFCKTCEKVFHLKPWEKYKNISINDLKCPYCNSHSYEWATWISKAIINKRPVQEISELLQEMDYRKLLAQLLKDEEKNEGVFKMYNG